MKNYTSIFRLIRLSILLLFGMLAISCNYIRMKRYGIVSPKLETETSLREYMARQKIDSSNVYMLKAPFVIESFAREINKAYLFDKQGLPVAFDEASSNKKCLGNIMSFLRTYSRGSNLSIAKTRSFDEEKDRWICLNGREPDALPLGADFTLVYYWNSFSGTGNQRQFLARIEKIMRERPDLEIVFYKVNQDFREDAMRELVNEQAKSQKDSLRSPTDK